MSTTPDHPYWPLDPLKPSQFREVWLETVFEDYKWDPQIGDVSVLTDFPLVLSECAWHELRQLAEKLAAEALAAERELLPRPDLHPTLGLPGAVKRVWRDPKRIKIGTIDDVRVIRFDFHYTPDGWRISEANTDTPGGFIEASGFTRRMMTHYSNVWPAGDPAGALAKAIRDRATVGALVAMIHATGYADDRQMMLFLEKALHQLGLESCLISPAQLKWNDGRACISTDWDNRSVAHIVRFFPAEWLPNLPRASHWERYFQDCQVPASNPTSALLVQSKRFPLLWDRLETPLPTWRALLPKTCDPRQVSDVEQGAWVIKPMLGRAGEDVSIYGLTPPKQWAAVLRSARHFPQEWIVQRRFDTVPVSVNGKSWYPSIGVYTVDGCAAGIYGRVASQPLINESAQDIAVFIAQ